MTNYSRGAQHPQFGKINDPNLDKGDFVFHLAEMQTPFMPSAPDEGQDRLTREQTTTEGERQALERLKALEKELEGERYRLEAEKQRLETAKLATGSNLPGLDRKLSILPFNISIDQAGRRNYIDREVISSVVKGLGDSLKETKVFRPTLSYYQLDERFDAEMVNEDVLADHRVDDLWVKKSFFSDPEPAIELIVQIGNQQKVDAVLLSHIDVSLEEDIIRVFLIDVKQNKKYEAQVTVSRIRSVGREKMRRLTKKVFAEYLRDNKQ